MCMQALAMKLVPELWAEFSSCNPHGNLSCAWLMFHALAAKLKAKMGGRRQVQTEFQASDALSNSSSSNTETSFVSSALMVDVRSWMLWASASRW